MDFFIILILILFNSFFAMAEIAIISARKNKLKHLALSGDKGAQIAFDLADKPSVFLSTIQIGITLIGILAGAIGDARIVSKLSLFLKPLPFIGVISEQIAFVIVVAVITYLSVVLGELLPKRIALSNSERIASFAAPIILKISNFTSPIVRFLSISTETVFKLIGLKPAVDPPITEDEIRVLISEGTNIGIFNKTEKKLIDRALLLDDLRVKMLMTPKHKIIIFDINQFTKHPRHYLFDYTHSRIIFTEGGPDKIVGVIHIKDLLPYHLKDDKFDVNKIKNVITKPHFVPENMRALKVLEIFRHSPVHIALVLDEFGSIQGLITLNDILEALVGEIKSQSYKDPEIVSKPDGSFFIDGTVSVNDLKKTLHLGKLPKEELSAYQTIGGFIISFLEQIPKTGDYFEWEGYRFEILDMDDNRVDKVLITKSKHHLSVKKLSTTH
ncbi:MAG: hemolysin family protein [Patescibacteria group bacterium]